MFTTETRGSISLSWLAAAALTLAIVASRRCQLHHNWRGNSSPDSDIFVRGREARDKYVGASREMLCLILETFVCGREAGNRGTTVVCPGARNARNILSLVFDAGRGGEEGQGSMSSIHLSQVTISPPPPFTGSCRPRRSD